jgi:hypothetical protein
VYACFGIFFIACLPKVTLILRYLWKTKFQGKLTDVAWVLSGAGHHIQTKNPGIFPSGEIFIY